MGQVYRARDTRLSRDVAFKILPDAFARDPDRLARFTREAQTLASLNHPNIAAIYGIEEWQDVRALVMELVEGEDLSAHIGRGPIPLTEALPIAKQIADALEAAHEQGIIHRDLKPANVKVRADGTVKVLDFGLAKAMEPASAMSVNAMTSPTLSIHATQAGIILGTAAYMSPEQAAGKLVDKRSDLWAFGVVLMEMLTGRSVFTGETVSHVLAAVLRAEPDWTTFHADTPAPIRRFRASRTARATGSESRVMRSATPSIVSMVAFIALKAMIQTRSCVRGTVMDGGRRRP
jgi:serine/threonine protein kinase